MRSGSVTKYGERYPRSNCMPSTTSSTVSADFDSSTVMTPSLPTFSIASAIRLPIVLSLFEAIVATWVISFLSLVDLESFFSSSVTASTAASMPRLSAIGLAPAVTLRRPSRKIACARTVAVVVPSPATSEVFEATSRTIWAPMFSYLSFSSISLATVTPSLVIVGLPNFLSMTTLRPFGPSVTLTASAMMLMPRSSAARASSSNLSCFGMGRVPPSHSRMARTSSSRMIRYSLSSSFTSEPEYFPNRILSPAFTSSGIFLPSSVTLPLPTAITLASCGFSLAVSGMMIPPFLTSFSSSRSTRMRSCSGRIFLVSLPPSCFVDVAPVFLAVGLTIPNPQRAVSTQTKRVLILAAAPARIKRKIRKENHGEKSFRFKCFAPRGVDADPQRSFRRLQRQPDRPFKTRADRPPEGQGWPHLSHHQLDRRRGPGGSADREGRRQCGRRLQQHRRRRRPPPGSGRHQHSGRAHRDDGGLRVGAPDGDRAARRRG